MYYYNYNMLNCISSDISNSSFENKSGHIYEHSKYLSTEDTINYLLKYPQNRKSFDEMIKSYILEKYNREHPKLNIDSNKVSIILENKPFNLLAIISDEVKNSEKIQQTFNTYIIYLINHDFVLERFLRMASFGNVGNSSLGTSGKNKIKEAIVFAFTDFEHPPPEIQSNGLFRALNTHPEYKKLKTIIKSMQLFRELSSLGSGLNDSNGQSGGMYRRKVFKRKTYKRHSILQPNRYRSKSSKRRLPQYFK
jgi:hypothetical protein